MITLKKSLPSQLQSCSRLDFLWHQWRPLQLVPANLRSGYLPLTLGHGHYGWHRWKQRPQYAAKPGVFLQSVADMIHHLQCYLHVYTCSSDWARNGGDSHPSHSATLAGCRSHSARVAEGSLSIHTQLKPRKIFTTHIVCGMTWRHLNLYWRHLILYSLLASFRDDVSYI